MRFGPHRPLYSGCCLGELVVGRRRLWPNIIIISMYLAIEDSAERRRAWIDVGSLPPTRPPFHVPAIKSLLLLSSFLLLIMHKGFWISGAPNVGGFGGGRGEKVAR